MTTRHEVVIASLLDALADHSATVLREQDLPVRLPPSGVINVVPGDPEEIEYRLGTGQREWEREVSLDHVAQDDSGVTLVATLDAMMAKTGALLSGNMLNGAVDYLLIGAPASAETMPLDGADTFRGTVVAVTLYYETSDNALETVQ